MIERNFVTPEILAKIDTVNKGCHELHVPAPPVVFVTTELFEHGGIPTLRQHEQSRSWTRNGYNYMATQMLLLVADAGDTGVAYGAGRMRGKQTNGSAITNSTATWGPFSTTRAKQIGENTASIGIVVGTGDTAASFEDYKLETIILNGSTSGKLAWDAAVPGTPAYNTETGKWTNTFYRDFTNNSGETITVKETGLYWNVNPGGVTACVERHVLASTVDVADGQTMRVTYTIELTFPA